MAKFEDCWTHDGLTPDEIAQVTCRACGHMDQYPPHVLARLFVPPVPIPVAERRLRCKWCGRKAAALRRVWRSRHG